MSDVHIFMLFGATIAVAGIWLAATSRSGHGQTTIRLLGGEITLAAAGGIGVVLLGATVFALPFILSWVASRPTIGQVVQLTAGDTPPPSGNPEADPSPIATSKTSSRSAANSGNAYQGILPESIYVSAGTSMLKGNILASACVTMLNKQALKENLHVIEARAANEFVYIRGGTKVLFTCGNTGASGWSLVAHAAASGSRDRTTTESYWADAFYDRAVSGE